MSGEIAAVLAPRGILEVLQKRIEDLTDEEMQWEPVPGCLRLGQQPERVTHFDGAETDPVSTIGWRLGHIAIDGLLSSRNPWILGVEATPPTVETPSTADDMRALLALGTDWWCGLIDGCDEEHLRQPIGFGPYADSPRVGFVLHINTDVIHHGGEVGVLRDLWRAGLR